MSARGELHRVVKQYGRHMAVADVSLSVSAGEIVGLVGPNGAGKSTLLRVFAGLLRPTAGTVTVPVRRVSSAVRYFAGEHTLPPAVPAKRWLQLWGAPPSAGAARRSLGALSRGTRQRVGLEATLVAPEPVLVLLDEPWEGLDPDASRWLSDELRRWRSAGAGVLVSTHRIHDLADLCDRCLFLVDGRLSREEIFAAWASEDSDRTAALFAAFDRAKAGR